MIRAMQWFQLRTIPRDKPKHLSKLKSVSWFACCSQLSFILFDTKNLNIWILSWKIYTFSRFFVTHFTFLHLANGILHLRFKENLRKNWRQSGETKRHFQLALQRFGISKETAEGNGEKKRQKGIGRKKLLFNKKMATKLFFANVWHLFFLSNSAERKISTVMLTDMKLETRRRFLILLCLQSH